MDTDILTILTKSDREEIKSAMKNLIIEQFESDLKDTDAFLFDYQSLEDMIEEVIEEVKTEIRPLAKKKLKAEMKSKLNL